MVPHTPMRRAIANHMARSLAAAPHVTSVFEADLSRVLAEREALKQSGKLGSAEYYGLLDSRGGERRSKRFPKRTAVGMKTPWRFLTISISALEPRPRTAAWSFR